MVSTIANDLVYAPGLGRLYISIPSEVGAAGNSVAPVDPATGAVGATIFVGSEPSKMALSDDGQTLYVGLNGAAAVRRVNLATSMPDLQFALGSSTFAGPYRAGDIAVAPGHPDWLAVVLSTNSSPGAQGMALFVNGIKSPVIPGFASGASRIAFGSDATRLYGYNDETSGFNFSRFNVSESGITSLDDKGAIFGGFGIGIHFANGRLYSDLGQIVDPEAGTLIATLSQGGIVCPDITHNRIYVAAANQTYTFQVYAFDATQFTPLSSRIIILPPQSIDGFFTTGVVRLVRWGSNGLAFLTADKRVVIMDNAP